MFTAPGGYSEYSADYHHPGSLGLDEGNLRNWIHAVVLAINPSPTKPLESNQEIPFDWFLEVLKQSQSFERLDQSEAFDCLNRRVGNESCQKRDN